MRRRFALFAFLTAAAVLQRPTLASEFSGAVTLTSQYIYRGQDLSDENPALQLGLDYEHSSGLFAGAWASTIDLSRGSDHRYVQLDYYAGYNYVPDGPVAASLSLVRHTYPGQTGSRDYDYTQALITAVPVPDPTAEVPDLPIKGYVPVAPEDTIGCCSFALRCPHAQKKCRSEKPQMIRVGDEHFASCFLIDGSISIG